MIKKLGDIPIVITSGQKYKNANGIMAIKDGAKYVTNPQTPLPKPKWLRVSPNYSANYQKIKQTVEQNKLSTVCEEAKCPNISECWSHGTATMMLLGSVCTRACRFCAVDTGNPQGWLNIHEPEQVANTVALMNLDYIVLTSVNRDDLGDGGAQHYADTICAIKNKCPKIKVEALTPDFQGVESSIIILLDSNVDVFAQNIETVERLTHPVRDNRASFWQTINVLAFAKSYRPNILTKTSLMLGLGESIDEILQTMDILRAHHVDILTLGQYMQPTRNHLPVIEYIAPEVFLELRQLGLAKGFLEVASGPTVRSSYRADQIFKQNNLGLKLEQQEEY